MVTASANDLVLLLCVWVHTQVHASKVDLKVLLKSVMVIILGPQAVVAVFVFCISQHYLIFLQ